MKRKIALFLTLALLLGCLPMTAQAAVPAETALASARALKTLGLFKGSDDGFELDRAPTRIEALIMLIRLLGEERYALAGDWQHPFIDTPGWANAYNYLGYAYQKGLTKGVNYKQFDPNSPAGAREVITMTLRALGYTDTDEYTVWDSWKELGLEAGLIFEELDENNFLRGDAACIYYIALNAKLASGENKGVTLMNVLLENGVFTADQLLWSSQIILGEVSVSQSPLDLLMAALYASVDVDLSYLHCINTWVTEENSRYFIGSDAVDFTSALASEPGMTSRAHSVALIRLKAGEDVEAAKAAIRQGVDPYKWICVGVEPENIRVVSRGDLILLVMDDNNANLFVSAFTSLPD